MPRTSCIMWPADAGPYHTLGLTLRHGDLSLDELCSLWVLHCNLYPSLRRAWLFMYSSTLDSCSDDFSFKSIQVAFRTGILGLMCDRKRVFSQQEHDTMENIVRNHRFFQGCEVGAGVSTVEKHVLLLIFSFCVIPPSRRINHKRVIPRNGEDLYPCQLSSPFCSSLLSRFYRTLTL